MSLYQILLTSHSYLRYFILIALLLVIVMSLMGWLNNKPYTNLDNRIGLYLLIFTHLQFVAGIILYFTSDVVQFNDQTMKNAELRYWAVEHIFAMVIAVALITVARSTSKRLPSDKARHKRLFILNTLALIIILATLAMSSRGIWGGVAV